MAYAELSDRLTRSGENEALLAPEGDQQASMEADNVQIYQPQLVARFHPCMPLLDGLCRLKPARLKPTSTPSSFVLIKKTIQTINYIIYSQKSPNQNALFFIVETLDSILRPLVISACSE